MVSDVSAEDHDRSIGRIDLAIAGIAGESRRQRAAGRVDRRLHVARRAVDVAVEIELQHDARRPERAGRGHLGDAGDAPERALERHGDGRGHGFGTRARQRRRHRDGREVDPRQRRDRKQAEGDRAGQGEADGDERRRDRTIDEGRRDVNGSPLGAARPSPEGEQFALGAARRAHAGAPHRKPPPDAEARAARRRARRASILRPSRSNAR